jgi:hypothetical protein
MKIYLYIGHHVVPGVPGVGQGGSARKLRKNIVSTEERIGSGSGEGGRKDDGKDFFLFNRNIYVCRCIYIWMYLLMLIFV